MYIILPSILCPLSTPPHPSFICGAQRDAKLLCGSWFVSFCRLLTLIRSLDPRLTQSLSLSLSLNLSLSMSVSAWVACVNWRQLNVKQHVNDFCGRSPSECVISRALKLDYSIRSAAFKCNQCKPNEFIITQPQKKISAQRESFLIEKTFKKSTLKCLSLNERYLIRT